MPIEITMPRLSDTMEEGTLIKWRVRAGDKISSGDVLADIETDKATMELQSYDDGTVAQLAVNEGETVPVGQLILVLAKEFESIENAVAAFDSGVDVGATTPTVAEESVSKESASATTTAASPVQAAPPSGAERIRVSPVARKIAEEHQLDLTTVRGTGPDGRIIKRDVLAVVGSAGAPAAPSPTATTAGVSAATVSGGLVSLEGKAVPLTNMRKTIARRLLESKTTIPHFTVTVSVAMDSLLDLRATVNAQLAEESGSSDSGGAASAGGRAMKLSVNDFVVRASALALVQHPAINASWTGDTILHYGTINIGVVVALPQEKGGGLVVPTIRDVSNKSLQQISEETRTVAKKAREQRLGPQEMSDATFTVSNLGMLGVEHFEAIINPPQSAILAVGAAIETPVVRDGQIVLGREMTCTLSADHRVIDGVMAAQFLRTLKQTLENPAVLLM